ncbi:expressed unknown protein [Seminavis robusta]|uniref:Uncharacterized protein n=1 Tax=Seminavis robusta TaxID=568900 RepID=A0A9N8EDH2_9STRA|nr:expressed unknown protein [Seminavis robusta]|eukprot:Sro836_g208980.1 n/a (613) ;mRNA; f:20645-22483
MATSPNRGFGTPGPRVPKSGVKLSVVTTPVSHSTRSTSSGSMMTTPSFSFHSPHNGSSSSSVSGGGYNLGSLSKGNKFHHHHHHNHNSSSLFWNKKNRSSILWMCLLLLMGAINMAYQWYNNDVRADFGILLNMGGARPNGVVNQQAETPPIRSGKPFEWKPPAALRAAADTADTDTTTTTLSNQQQQQEPVFDYTLPASSDATVVFYHIYFPPTDEGRLNSLRIIAEQLQQLANSTTSPNFVLYYNTIGEQTPALEDTHIQQLCLRSKLTCHAMQHFSEGMEDKTLQPLHDFCSLQTEPETDYSVVYLHNKGSFNAKPLNEVWRYQMTQAVVSPECQQHTTNVPGQCNLCGLYFSAERGLFMAGNMWRSKCSYVRNLLPPRDFQDAMHAITAQALMERLRFRFVMTLQELRAGVFGIDRYATEFWIASHPFVRPCDFSKAIAPPTSYDMTEIFLRWLRVQEPHNGTLESEWFAKTAPHHPLPIFNGQGLDVARFPDVRLREYFLLAGNLFRWYGLYGQAPPVAPTSWVYEWFPDGAKWKAAVQEHDKDSVEFMTEAALQMEIESGRNKFTRDNTKPQPPNGFVNTNSNNKKKSRASNKKRKTGKNRKAAGR